MLTSNSLLPFNRRFPFIILLTLLAISCAKEETPSVAPACCDPVFLGQYLLMPGSRNAIPYQADATLYFKDESGNEVAFTLRNDDDGYDTTDMGTGRNCPCDTNFIQTLKASGDAYYYFLKQPDLSFDIRFLITLSTYPFHGDEYLAADILEISIQDPNDTTSFGGALLVLVDPRNLTEEYLKWYKAAPADSLQLSGITFYDVYAEEDSLVFYNYEKGLVAFKDRQDKLWVLDRVE